MKQSLLFIAVAMLAFAACSREEETPVPEKPGKEEQQKPQDPEDPTEPEDSIVTIKVSIPEETYSKVSLAESDGSLTAAWEESDRIRIISGNKSEEYSITQILSPGVAEFSGRKVEGESFDILYPGNYASLEEALADTESPVQTGNGSTEHLRFRALIQGVNNCDSVAFSGSWAAEHGGAITLAPALKLTAALPAGTGVVDTLRLLIDEKEYVLPLKDVDVTAQEGVLTAYMMLPCEQLSLAPGAVVALSVSDPDENIYSATLPTEDGKNIVQGRVNVLSEEAISLAAQPFAGGEGTAASPWIIANARHLDNIHDALEAGETKYFSLSKDIDASGIENWVPFNADAPFDKGINLDGANHVISGLKSSGVAYASFAGVLYGDIHDITFSGATINASTKCGVVAGFLGTCTNDYSRVATCTNVTVTGSTVTGTDWAGGFAGHVRGKGAVTGCKVVNTTVSAGSQLGGFTAQADITGVDKYEVPVIFTSCEVDGVTLNQNCATAGSKFTGGFAGYTYQAVSFIGCKVKGTTITATKAAIENIGGFIGGTDYAGANFKNCSVDASTTITAQGAHVGGFVGWANVPDAYTDCSSAAKVTNSLTYTGGFVGYATGASTYTNCTAKGDVTGERFSAGFAGVAENASFTSCSYSSGSFTSTANNNNARCGGFVGSAISGLSFRDCSVSDASVSGPKAGRTAGFAGQLGNSYTSDNNITCSHCYVQNTNVSGAINTGAFIGVEYSPVSRCYVSGGKVTAGANQCGGFSAFVQNSTITHCYTTATVDGGSYSSVGGFVGILYDGTISYCYSSGSVSGGSNTGAFVGQCAKQGNVGSVSSCIAWNASLPLYGSNTVGATFTDCYNGVEGTISAKAVELAWPSTAWDFSGTAPTLLPGEARIPAIFVGDSITWQWASNGRTDKKSTIENATHGALVLDPLPSYMTISGENITTKFHPQFFAGHGYIDKGISGQNTTQMKERFEKDVLSLNPQVFVLMGGTNDLAQGVSKDDIFANVTYMCSTAIEAGIKVVLCSITPNNNTYSRLNPKTKGVHIEALNERFKAYADSTPGCTYCDYWSSLVAAEGEVADQNDVGYGLKDRFRLYDALHPGPDAYTVMEGIVNPIIQNLISQ
ncbi:MAG: hypothetical protein K6F58_02360 [Bacteroidales bacterium]|nr:hypothetical protein [Bacteroidales bacterium]